MLADELDYVIGVDPHRDAHALAVVDVRSGGVVFEATAVADDEGYACVLRLSDQHAPGRRVFAVEGTASFGAGLTRFLVSHEERVLEVGRLRRERLSGKSDALDAIRAARSVLGQTRPARPRAGGEREALRALAAAREGAVTARRAGLCQLRGLLVSAPEPLRAELRFADPGAAPAATRRGPSWTLSGPGAPRDVARASRSRAARHRTDR
jgi:transposase